MVRCTALAFCTQLQVAISVYDASNAAPCAWHAQSANAARGQVALNRWQLTACTTKRRLVSKKSQTSQIPILPTFFLPHGQALPRQSKIQTARTFGSWMPAGMIFCILQAALRSKHYTEVTFHCETARNLLHVATGNRVHEHKI